MGIGVDEGIGEPRVLSSFTAGISGDDVGEGAATSARRGSDGDGSVCPSTSLGIFASLRGAVAAGFVRQRREKLSNVAIVLVVPASSSKRMSPSVSPAFCTTEGMSTSATKSPW